MTGESRLAARAAAVVLACSTLGLACDIDHARYYDTLEAAGFSNVKLTGFEWFRCADGEFNTGFEATNPKGQRVAGTVCCGYVKGCTVRF